MKTYEVKVGLVTTYFVEVRAESEEEALLFAENMQVDDIRSGDYFDDSVEVYEALELNESGDDEDE